MSATPAQPAPPIFDRSFLCAVLVAFALVIGLAACGSSESDNEAYNEQPVEDLYNHGMDLMLIGDYEQATQAFDEVERQHPYSVWASKAQIMAAYSQYQANNYDEAVAALDRFIELHPGNRDIAYAYYLKALCYYEQISDVGRDQRMTRLALETLEEVVRRFPESSYARDASLKIDLARDHLAGKHMEIGRYYQDRGEVVAAINRFQTVIKDFQTTSHVPEALHRLVELYLTIGVTGEAQAVAAVLGYNFPGSEWYADSYELLTGQGLEPEESDDSWISSVWGAVF